MKLKKFLLLSFLILLYTWKVFPQNINVDKFQYLSPVPNSKLNSPETNFIIRFGKSFKNPGTEKIPSVMAKGSKSGIHKGKVVFAEENMTLIFYPDKHFDDGETVTFELNVDQNGNKLKTNSGKTLPPLLYSFETSQINLNKKIKSDPAKQAKYSFPDLAAPGDYKKGKPKLMKKVKVSGFLPKDFPEITVDSVNNPSPGFIFFAPYVELKMAPTYLIIADNSGLPVFYRKINSRVLDFKKQVTGVLTYCDASTFKYYVIDSSYNIIDSLYMKNGYLTDIHGLEILKNGHALLMSYDFQRVGMDTIVKGGKPNATVIGFVIQELDQKKNVVFQWRSFDHFKITDATYNFNMKAHVVDYVHGNDVAMDYDGNILISCRHMDEVTKINRNTGEIIWRWGGKYCKNNQFTFTNDSITFSHQHDITPLPNGDISLFDNGNLHNPKFSRAAEYRLDEHSKTATLVWEYRNKPKTYTVAMGSVTRLDNNNIFIGWGANSIPPSTCEIDYNGKVTLLLSFPDTLWSYRAFKYTWETNLFTVDTDSLHFKSVRAGDSLNKFIKIKNNSTKQLEINNFYCRESAFTVNASLPLLIQPDESKTVQVVFKPETNRVYNDDLYIRSDNEKEGVAQKVKLIGTAD